MVVSYASPQQRGELVGQAHVEARGRRGELHLGGVEEIKVSGVSGDVPWGLFLCGGGVTSLLLYGVGKKFKSWWGIKSWKNVKNALTLLSLGNVLIGVLLNLIVTTPVSSEKGMNLVSFDRIIHFQTTLRCGFPALVGLRLHERVSACAVVVGRCTGCD